MAAQQRFAEFGATNFAALTERVLIKRLQQEADYSSYFTRFTDIIENQIDMVPTNVIVEKNQLITDGGDRIRLPLLRELQNEGKAGDLQIKGQEEKQAFRIIEVGINQLRQAVAVQGGASEQRVKRFQFLQQTRPQLSRWWGKELDFSAFYALLEGVPRHISATVANGGINFDSGAGAGNQKSHPFIFTAGDSEVTFSTTAATYETNIETSVDTITNGTDIMSLNLLDDIANKTLDLKLQPIMVEGQQTFVVLMHHNAWLQLSGAGSTFQNLVRDAELRSSKNPVFTGARGFYKGLAIHVHPHVPGVVTDASGEVNWGTTTPHTALDTADDKVTFVLGAGALCKAVGMNMRFETEEDDYRNVKGVAAPMNYGYRRTDWTPDDGTTERPIVPNSFLVLHDSPNPNFAS